MPILIASTNRHKVDEIIKGLALPKPLLRTLLDFPRAPAVIEDGDSFEANARKKALSLSRFSQLWAIADDSGLEVDALDGAPGVRSARFAGLHGDDQANNARVLQLLSGRQHRRARFRCVLALCSPSGDCHTVEGVCEGDLATKLKGRNGFGYDPLFIPQGYQHTFGELSSRTKRSISHRARALHSARKAWAHLLHSECDTLAFTQ